MTSTNAVTLFPFYFNFSLCWLVTRTWHFKFHGTSVGQTSRANDWSSSSIFTHMQYLSLSVCHSVLYSLFKTSHALLSPFVQLIELVNASIVPSSLSMNHRSQIQNTTLLLFLFFTFLYEIPPWIRNFIDYIPTTFYASCFYVDFLLLLFTFTTKFFLRYRIPSVTTFSIPICLLFCYTSVITLHFYSLQYFPYYSLPCL